MKYLSTTLFLLVAFIASAQCASKVVQTTGLTYPHGFEPYSADNSVFFNAFHPRRGFQLFQLKGDRLIQVSSFKQKLEKKEEPEAYQGGQTSNYKWFNNQLYFFAKGKGFKSGLYSYNGGRPQLVYKCEAMSRGYLRGKKLETQVVVRKGDSTEFHHIVIDNYNKIRRYLLNQVNICSELARFNNTNYGVLDGMLGAITTTDAAVGFTAVQFDKAHLDYARSLTVTSSHLVYQATNIDMNVNLIVSLSKAGDIKTYRVYDYAGDMMTSVNNAVYFTAHEDDITKLYRFDGKVNPLEVETLPNNTMITSAAYINKQWMLTLGNGFRSSLYHVNYLSLREQDVRYIDNIRGAATLKDRLVFMGAENGHDQIYASEPLLPPIVNNQKFDIYDFYDNGRVFGAVEAKSQSSKKGRFKYQIVSGNEDAIFAIDELDGELKVADSRALSPGTTHTLIVSVKEKRAGTASAKIEISVGTGEPFSQFKLRETLMFFPDFNRANTLTTSRIPDKQDVFVYDMNFNMVDILKVDQGVLSLGNYRPGKYILNVRNTENLYQKIELQ